MSREPSSDLTDHPRRSPGIAAGEGQGRVVLMRPGGGYHLLDELGALIWDLCDGTRSLDQVIAAAAARRDEPPAIVAGDVREWIAELRVERLLLQPE